MFDQPNSRRAIATHLEQEAFLLFGYDNASDDRDRALLFELESGLKKVSQRRVRRRQLNTYACFCITETQLLGNLGNTLVCK